MQVDFLIVGQGLAGTLLALALRARGQKVAVVDDGWKSSASQVAAGLMTPLTGRRFTLTPSYPELFAFAERRLTELGVFRPTSVYRMFADDEQKEKGQKRAAMPAYAPFIARGEGYALDPRRLTGLTVHPFRVGKEDLLLLLRGDELADTIAPVLMASIEGVVRILGS
jgi:glycine/D-amino acid oxidase-like deaminating enzyme